MLTANSYFQNMKLGPIQLPPHWHFPFFLILLIIFCCPFCPPLSVAHLGLPYHQHGGLQCRHLCTENGASRKILSVLNGESTIHVTKSGAKCKACSSHKESMKTDLAGLSQPESDMSCSVRRNWFHFKTRFHLQGILGAGAERAPLTSCCNESPT